jgi:putative phage-type endonuclease
MNAPNVLAAGGLARDFLSAVDSAMFDVIQCANEEAWLKERDNGIGASEIAVLLGLSEWSSPFHLWAQKTGRLTKGASDAEHLEYGRFMEDGAAKRYAYRTGRMLQDLGRYTILRSKRWPFLFTTLDRIITDLPPADSFFAQAYPIDGLEGPGCCEIKNPIIHGYRAWDEGVPLHYQAQLQGQLAVTGFRWGSFGASMPDGTFLAIDMMRNEDFITMAVEKATAFMECVTSDTWPPVDGSEWTKLALKAMFPMDSGEEVELPPEAEEWDRELREAKAQRKLAEEHEELMSNKLRAAIGAASIGRLPSGDCYTHHSQHRAEFVTKASSFRVLRLSKAKGIPGKKKKS